MIHFSVMHTEIKILTKKNLRVSAERRKLHQVVRELLEDTICEIRGQHPPPVLKGLRKS